MSHDNVIQFKTALYQVSWENVLVNNEVDEAFTEFWNTFDSLFQLYCPISKVKFNRNIHRINDYMTAGLLVSRKTKLQLHKRSLVSPTDNNISKYRNYRNIYNRLIRHSKKLYFEKGFYRARRNPKKLGP